MLAAYGVGAGDPADYAHFCGLVLNLPRVRAQRAVAAFQGAAFAASSAALPFDFFDATADSEEQAEDLQFEANAARATARARAKAWGSR